MESWKNCGEGFSGVQKLSRIVSLRQKHLSPGEENGRNVKSEPEIGIVSKDSPEPKKRLRPWISSKIAVQGKVPALVKGSWKPDVLLANFETSSAGISRLENEEIEYTSSSSDSSDVSLKNAGKNDEKEARKLDHVINKRKGFRKKHRQMSEKSLADSPEHPDLKSTVKTARSHAISKASWSHPSFSKALQEGATMKKLSDTRISLSSNKNWHVPSFESSDQTTVTDIQSAQSPVQRPCKKGERREGHGKPRAVRKLLTKLSEDSSAFISDVDSDCQEEEECAIQTFQDVGCVRRKTCTEDGFSCSPNNNREDLSPKEISLASSPNSQSDEKDGISLSMKSKNSQVSISSGLSSQSYLSQQKDTIKASEWVSTLQQRTPVKNDGTHETYLEDSAKKKRKFSSGSLADRLLRMQRRLKSSVRMWSHSTKAGDLSADTKAKSVEVVIQSVHKQCSLYLCDCKITSKHEEGQECKVFFSRETAEMLALKVGTSVQIYPPWQQLQTDGGERTLLCTDFVCTVPQPETPSMMMKESPQTESLPVLQVKATWNCPCAKDPRLPSSVCPSVKYPSTPHLYRKGTDRVTPSPHSKFCGQPTRSKTATLQSVHCVSPCSSLGFLDFSKTVATFKASSVGRTLQDSREMLTYSSDILPPFSATVLRVFVQRSLNVGFVVRHQLLLMDSAGTVALATLPLVHSGGRDETTRGTSSDDQQMLDPSLSIGRLEGRTCTCSGFTVASRITHDQDPSLFSVLQGAWHCNSSSLSQSQNVNVTDPNPTWRDDVSDTSQQGASKCRVAPPFAYVLQAYPGSHGGQVEVETQSKLSQEGEECSEKRGSTTADSSGSVHKGLNLMTLHQALQDKANDSGRVTFIAKMAICHGEEDSRTPSSMLVYDEVTDECGHSALHSLQLGRHSMPGHLSPSPCLFRDVLRCAKDSLQCDAYSLILPQTRWSAWGLDHLLDHSERALVERLATSTLSVPQLRHSSGEGVVVSVEGQIEGVDEESACMVEECCVCGSDLVVPESGSMHCAVCNKDVQDSVCVMKMSAFISCSGIASDVFVKVQLAQKSIEKILPEEADEDGYDVEQVIGKSVACGVCLVESNTVNVKNTSKKIIILKELEYT